jgi:hypothetical protein
LCLLQARNPRENFKAPTNGRKRKNRSVKPQNIGPQKDRPQCTQFRQTATCTLGVGHFSSNKPFIHRVIHRNWGALERAKNKHKESEELVKKLGEHRDDFS